MSAIDKEALEAAEKQSLGVRMISRFAEFEKAEKFWKSGYIGVKPAMQAALARRKRALQAHLS